MAQNASTEHKRGIFTPLAIISALIAIVETAGMYAALKTEGYVQWAFILFFIGFAFFVGAWFFIVLFWRAWAFYSPSEYGKVDVQKFIAAQMGYRFDRPTKKTSDLQGKIKVVGDPDQMVLLFKATGKGFIKSTKAMDVGCGCVIQTSTEMVSYDGSISVAEALVFVPNVMIVKNENGDGGRLEQKDSA